MADVNGKSTHRCVMSVSHVELSLGLRAISAIGPLIRHELDLSRCKGDTDLQILGCFLIRESLQFLQEQFWREPLLESCKHHGLWSKNDDEEPSQQII